MTHSGETKLAGIMGWPVAHSKSPRLHGYWLDTLDIDGAYVPLAVMPERLGEAIAGLRGLGFQGANLTIPHKEAALAFCDVLDGTAERIGAVNTLTVGADGRIAATNTDAFGFVENLRQNSDWRADAGPAVLLGAGGAARAIAVALTDAGASDIRIVNRTVAKAESFIASTDLRGATAVAWDDRAAALTEAALLVNATSLGMAGKAVLDIDLATLPVRAVVNDIVYTPLTTPLLAEARRRGNPTVDGLGMLLYQAQAGFESWFGVRPSVDAALRAFVLS